MEPTTVLCWIGIYGVVTGFRTFLPLAVLSFLAWRAEIPLAGHWTIVAQFWCMLLIFLLAAGELGADKWKGMPNRTAPLGLLGRFSVGALGGAILAASNLIPWWKGAAVGGVLALFGAALGYSLRQYFREATRAPDLYVAVGEDFVTFLGAYWVLTHLG